MFNEDVLLYSFNVDDISSERSDASIIGSDNVVQNKKGLNAYGKLLIVICDAVVFVMPVASMATCVTYN